MIVSHSWKVARAGFERSPLLPRPLQDFLPSSLWAVPEAIIVFLGLYPLSSGAGAPDLISLTAQEVKNL